MRSRRSIITYVFIILFALGVIRRFSHNISQLLIPVIVLGTVFIMYKFPQIRSLFSQSQFNRGKPRFKVIDGQKKDDRSKKTSDHPEEPPKFH